MILMLDNYDSFTYNLVQYFGELGADLEVYRNDEISLSDILRMKPEKIVISPGPGRPENAGITVDLIKEFSGKIPMLGVCLGHQAMGYAFGGKIIRAKKIMHGKTSQIFHNNQDLFKGLENPFEATRYHSLVIERESLPDCFDITAETDDGEIMGVRHKEFPLWGVQFHPESILTGAGKKMLKNFLSLDRGSVHRTHICLKQFNQKLHQKENLDPEEIESVMHAIMSGQALKEDIAEFLLALREKGPSVEEITGAAKIMRQFVIGVKSDHENVLDTCGTGGDKKNTFNISTVTALVVAAGGVPVAKHGNRSVSSKCGSADILEALGVNLKMEERHLKECLDTVGIAFLFAQRLHPAMKNVAPVRKELGVETIFNVLGPLTNPAGATHQIVGVYSRDLVEPVCHVLKNLGLKRALVVHGADGLDEITLADKTFIAEYDGKDIVTYDIDPEELGMSLAELEDLEGGDIDFNVSVVKNILSGKKGAKRDIVILNAAYAFYTFGTVTTIPEGIALAQDLLDKGKAADKLEELKDFTNRVS